MKELDPDIVEFVNSHQNLFDTDYNFYLNGRSYNLFRYAYDQMVKNEPTVYTTVDWKEYKELYEKYIVQTVERLEK